MNARIMSNTATWFAIVVVSMTMFLAVMGRGVEGKAVWKRETQGTESQGGVVWINKTPQKSIQKREANMEVQPVPIEDDLVLGHQAILDDSAPGVEIQQQKDSDLAAIKFNCLNVCEKLFNLKDRMKVSNGNQLNRY